MRASASGAGPFAGSSDALALADLARRATAHKRMVAVVSAEPLRSAAPRRRDRRGSRRTFASRIAPGLGNAALRPLLAAPGPRVRAARDAVSRLARRMRRADRRRRRPRCIGSRRRRISPAFTFFLKQGETLDVDALRAQLALAGYSHVTQVVSPGEFSVRGGLIDLFPMGSALPYRIDLFDNEIETIKTFDVDTQRTLYPVPDVRLLPAREFPLDEAGPHALPQRFREVFEGDPSKSRAVQGREQRHRARRHRVLPAAVLRATATLRRLPAARPRSSRCTATCAAPSSASGRTPSRATGCCAATRRARCCRRPSCSSRPTRSSARIKPFRAHRDRSSARRRVRRRDAPLPSVQVDRRADDPLAALKRYVADARRRVADRRRKRRPPRDDAAVLRRVRLAARARATTSPRSPRATHGDAGRRAARVPASRGRQASWPSSPRPSSTPASCAATRARGGASARNVDAMVRDLSEVRIGDPVVHEQHGIGRYLGLLHARPRRRRQRVPAARLRQRRQALRAGVEPAPHQPLQRRVARGRAAARARQRPVGEGEEEGGAAGARHRGGAAQPLRAARGAHRATRSRSSRTTTRRSPKGSPSRRRPTRRRRSRR